MEDLPLDSEHVSELQRLLTSERVLNSMAAGLVLQGDDGVILDYNEAATKLLGIGGENLVGLKSTDRAWNAVREDGTPFPIDERPSIVALTTGQRVSEVIEGIDVPGRGRRWLTINSYPVTLEGGSRVTISSFIDVTSRLQSERMLRLLSEVSRDVLLARTEAEAQAGLCRGLVEKGHYGLAWIGASSPTGLDVDIVCAAGQTGYLSEGADCWWGPVSDDGEKAQFLPHATTQVCADLATGAASDVGRERAVRANLRSSIALPFHLDGTRAVLVVYERSANQFDDITVAGLEVFVQEVELIVARVRALEHAEATLQATTAAYERLAERERALADSELRFRVAFEDNMSPMVFSDLDDHTTAVNDAFCEMVGYTREELIGFDTKVFTYPDDFGITEQSLQHARSGKVDQLRYTKRYRRKDGRVIFSEVSRSPARDAQGNILYFVFSERDVTEERALTSQLSHQALHDPLTGLANRALFIDRLSQARLRVARDGGKGAVLILDLDDFKGVNDTFGHVAGDQLLVAVARRLEHAARSSDSLCRFGGDEFLYSAENLQSIAEAEAVAQRLLDAMAEPFVLEGMLVQQHLSIGIVVWSDADASPEEFVRNADVALYQAKRWGGGTYVVFTPSMREKMAGNFALQQDLGHALAEGTISMQYQPIVRLDTTEIVGFEALMRWHHRVHGWVPPDVFIPLAEQSGLILELGAFALNEAVAAASTWSAPRPGADRPFVTVNISARQFQDSDLSSKIERALTKSRFPAERLIIEITESVTLLDVSETSNVIARLTRLGVTFALDDFGTGYSSLAYLASLSPQMIKVDQSFVNPPHWSERNDSLLEAIIALGRKLDGTMLGEGIETVEQLERLRQIGCQLGQGFLFSPAVPAASVAELLSNGPDQWSF
jgi:diguanylate cyclase (GGDEF)-like protein/PAS domain S-box-containing protein